MTSALDGPAVAGTSPAERRGWDLALTLALAGLGFFLPFSTAGVAISQGVLLLLVLIRPGAVIRVAPWREPVMAAGLALLAYVAIHTLATGGLDGASWHGFNQYQELLFAPMLLALLRDPRDRLVFIRALLVSAVLLALLYWAAVLEPRLYAQGGSLERRRISAGFALAVCAFVLLVRAPAQRLPWLARSTSAFLALTVLFVIDARTGQVVLLLLVSFAGWLHAPRRWRWLAAVAAPVLVLAVAIHSEPVQTRIAESLAGSRTAGPNGEMSSTGIRIELLRTAAHLARRYWSTGAGYGSYAVVHEKSVRERYSDSAISRSVVVGGDWARSHNPHSEYLMHLISGGIVGLALFLAWLGFAFRHAARAPPNVSGALTGVTAAFALGCVFNSLLMGFIEGHFYMALLAWFVAESRYPAVDKNRVDRILVVATRQIGDVLLTTPLLRAARRRWPHAHIDVLGFSGTVGMLRGNRDVDDLLEFPSRLGWAGSRSLWRRVWRRYDLALIADPGDRAHLIGWIAAPCRSGIIPAGGGSNWLKRLSLDHVVLSAGDRGDVHVTVEKQSLLAPWLDAAAVGEHVVPPPAVPLPHHVAERVRPGAIVVHAPSMWAYKQWPMDHFRSLVAALLAQGRQVILTGSASERDQECIGALRDLAEPPRLLDLSGQLDFNQLAALLQDAALYIGPDTSVSHLAAATGVPVLAIFGPTNPLRWAPWPAQAATQALFQRSAAVQRVGNVTVLQGSQSCVPCGRAGCEDHRASRSDCLASITPERVLEQALQILAQEAGGNVSRRRSRDRDLRSGRPLMDQ